MLLVVYGSGTPDNPLDALATNARPRCSVSLFLDVIGVSKASGRPRMQGTAIQQIPESRSGRQRIAKHDAGAPLLRVHQALLARIYIVFCRNLSAFVH